MAEARLRQIKASAGSGKTYELTRCFLQLLAHCGPPERAAFSSRVCAFTSDTEKSRWGDILAVTFTNAAAAEMRERVIHRLKSTALAGDDAPDADFGMSSARAKLWVDAVMRDMSALNIRTIDSLLHLVVRAAALELNLHPDFQPVFAGEEALAPYLDVFMERAGRNDERMLGVLRSAFRALIVYGNSKGFQAGEKLLQHLRDLMDDALLGRYDELSSEPELKAQLELLETEFTQAAQAMLHAAKADALLWKKPALAVLEQAASGKMKTAESAYCEKADATPLFCKNPHIPATTATAYARLTTAAAHCKAEYGILIRALRMAPFVHLATGLARAFLQNQEQEGLLPNLLVPQLAQQVLCSEYGVPDALCRLGTRLTHFLLDEFQDTGHEQWDALRPLLEEALSRGGSLTWVGDVKQSVYGWRGADPALFDALLDDAALIRPGGTPAQHRLPCNYRSRRCIVEHNNRFFVPLEDAETALAVTRALLPGATPLHILQDSATRLQHAFTGVSQDMPLNAPENGFVRAEMVAAEDTESLNRAVLERLSDLLHEEIGPRRPWSDVLVLVRSNDTSRLTAERLLADGIPVITENSLLLAEHPLIVQTMAFLSFLDRPDDDMAFWTMLTGTIVSTHPAIHLDTDALHAWCAQRGRGPLYKAFKEYQPELWERAFAPFYSRAGLMTPYDTVSEWFAFLDVEARFAQARTFVRRLLEVLQNAEEKGMASLPAFLEHWRNKGGEEKTPMPENADAVRIMTIHKSKGLEAPVVIVPWTGLRPTVSGKPVVYEAFGLRMVTAAHKDIGDPYYVELARQTRENMHLLYVAFTRARDELYVFHTETPGQNALPSLRKGMDILREKSGLPLPYSLGEANTEACADAADTLRATMPEMMASTAAETPNKAILNTCDNMGDLLAASAVHDNTRAEACTKTSAKPCTEAGFKANIDAGVTMGVETDGASLPYGMRPMQWLPRLKIFRNPLGGFAFKPEDRGSLLHFCLEHLRCTQNPAQDAARAVQFGLRRFARAVPSASETPDIHANLVEGLTSALTWFAAHPQTAGLLNSGMPEQSVIDAQGNVLRMDLLVEEPWGLLVVDYKSGWPEPEHIAQVRRYMRCLEEGAARPNQAILGLLVYLDQQRFQLVSATTCSDLVQEYAPLLPTLPRAQAASAAAADGPNNTKGVRL